MSFALLLRFYMQLINIPYHNPLSHFLITITDFIVLPTSKISPRFKGINLSALFLAWLAQFILIIGIYKIQGNNLSSDLSTATVALMLLAFIEIIKTTFHILMIAIIGQAILSWVSPHNPMSALLYSFTRPFIKIFSKRIPPIGNIDLSPLFVLIIIQLLLMVTTGLQQNIYQLF